MIVVQNATKGIIFSYTSAGDDDEGIEKYRMINLETVFNHKPFDVKLLDHQGVDIVVSGNAFVSDIKFNDSHRKELLSSEFYKVKSNFNTYVDKLEALMVIRKPFPGYKSNTIKHWYKKSYKKNGPKTVDYHDPGNWALTYKMRGFSDLYAKCYPNNHKLIEGVTAFSLYLILKVNNGELVDWEWDGCDEIEFDEDSENEEEVEEEDIIEEKVQKQDDSMDSDDEVNVKLYNTKVDKTNSKACMTNCYGKRALPPCEEEKWRAVFKDNTDKLNHRWSSDDNLYNDKTNCLSEYLASVIKPNGLLPEHVKALKNIDIRNFVYIEHDSITPECIEIKERIISVTLPDQSKILDLYDKGAENPYGTIIEVPFCSPKLTDYEIHSDEGFYDSGVNYYNGNQGIVLSGDQTSGSVDYANAMYDEIIIPDVFYEPL